MLDGVDRLAVATDEQTQVVTVENAADPVGVLEDLDLSIELERVVHVFEKLAHTSGGGGLGIAHRRLPERFFFLRGDGGGGADRFLRALDDDPPDGPPDDPPDPLARAAVAGRPAGVLADEAVAVPAAAEPDDAPAAVGAGVLPRCSMRSISDIGASSECGRSGPRRLRTIACWTIVQRFVVIQ